MCLSGSRGFSSSLWCLIVSLRGIRSGFGVVAIRRSPQSQVVTEKLHDERAVSIGFLRQRVEFGNRVVESLLGEMASTVGGVEDLVIEYGEVERKPKTDGVGRCEFCLGNVCSALDEYVSACFETKSYVEAIVGSRSIRNDLDDALGLSYLVCLVGGSGSILALLARGKLSEVAMVVALPTKSKC
jgi:hypothetical protein